MIEVYKIISYIYDSNTSQTILNFREKNSINLRGHQFTLEHKRLHTPSRVNYFANRVVNNWNSLPDYVIGAGTLNMFKNQTCQQKYIKKSENCGSPIEARKAS